MGVDVSEEIIRLARVTEDQTPLGIEYICCDARNLGVIGHFDIITAAHVLHYAPTREGLTRMCQHIHANLKPGGRLVAMITHPDLDPTGSDR